MKPEDRSHFPDRFPESTLVLPFITVIQDSPVAPTPKQCRSSPEREAGTSFERIAGAAVQREPQTTASYDSCAPKIPSAFRLTRYRHPTQGRDTLDRDNHSPLNGCSLGCPTSDLTWMVPFLKQACSWSPMSAICVQNFDDSLSPAIHTRYRISLRSSSLREPRYPLLRVVLDLNRSARLAQAARLRLTLCRLHTPPTREGRTRAEPARY